MAFAVTMSAFAVKEYTMSSDQKAEGQARKTAGRRKPKRVARRGTEIVIVGHQAHDVKQSERPLALVGVGKDPYEQAQATRTGLKTKILENLRAKGWISKNEVYVVVDPRTLSHRIAKNQPLSVEEADRAIRVARLLEKALNVFGNQEKVMHWWRRSSPRFANSSPLELARTEHGGRLVEEALIQIDEGMFA